MSEVPIKADRVDAIRAEWDRERPDLDTWPLEVVARAGRLARYLDHGLERFFVEHGISRADWDVLATLRRSGPPYRLSPTELYRSVMRTSGAMTHRIDRLERAGLVARGTDPDDRRALLITLTREGWALVDRLAPEHLDNERALLASLSRSEQQALADSLRKLLRAFELEQPTPPAARKRPTRHRRLGP